MPQSPLQIVIRKAFSRPAALRSTRPRERPPAHKADKRRRRFHLRLDEERIGHERGMGKKGVEGRENRDTSSAGRRVKVGPLLSPPPPRSRHF